MSSFPLPSSSSSFPSSSSSQRPAHKHVRSKSSTNDETSTTATRRDLQNLDPEILNRLQTIGMRSRKAVADGYATRHFEQMAALRSGSSQGGLERTMSVPTMVSVNGKMVLCPEHVGAGSGMMVDHPRGLEPFAETGHGLQTEKERSRRKREASGHRGGRLEGEDGTIPTDPESDGEPEPSSSSLAAAAARPIKVLGRAIAHPRRGLSKYKSMPEAALRRQAIGLTAPTLSNAMEEESEPWQQVQLDGYFDAQSGF